MKPSSPWARGERGRWECTEKRGSPPVGMGFSARGLFISAKLPLEGQMLLAKNGPRVAHQQINQGHGRGERLRMEERGVLG